MLDDNEIESEESNPDLEDDDDDDDDDDDVNSDDVDDDEEESEDLEEDDDEFEEDPDSEDIQKHVASQDNIPPSQRQRFLLAAAAAAASGQPGAAATAGGGGLTIAGHHPDSVAGLKEIEADLARLGDGAPAGACAGGDMHPVDPETQARLEALLEAAGMGSKLGESKQLTDPEVTFLVTV